jgi:guanylate kinase
MKMLIVLLGFSGSGKTTIGEYLKTIGFKKAVTNTTRDPRVGEVNGIDYHFKTDKEEFFKSNLIEFTEYPKNSGKFYGLSVEELEAKKDDNIYVILELSGALKVKELMSEAKIIFVNTDEDILRQRMVDRGDDPIHIEERIKNIYSSDEYKSINYADYIINNNDLEQAKKDIKDLISKL